MIRQVRSWPVGGFGMSALFLASRRISILAIRQRESLTLTDLRNILRYEVSLAKKKNYVSRRWTECDLPQSSLRSSTASASAWRFLAQIESAIFHTSGLAVRSESLNDRLSASLGEDVRDGLWSDATGICSCDADSLFKFRERACCCFVFAFSSVVVGFVCVMELSANTCSALEEDCGRPSHSYLCSIRSFHLEIYSSRMHCAPWLGMYFDLSDSKRAR